MEHPNVEQLRAFLDAYASGDPDALRATLAEDPIWHVGGTHALSGDYRGRDAILDYFARVGTETDQTLRLEPIELLANEARGAAFLRVTGKRGDRTLDVTMAEAIQFDGDGRIQEFWAHATDQDAINRFWD